MNGLEEKLLHRWIMDYATKWATGDPMAEKCHGIAMGLVYAHMLFTCDSEAHDGYFAMLGV